MIALLEKDLFVLWKQMRIYAVLIAIYMCAPTLFLNIFGIVYAAIMPYTAAAYDERSKWDQLAAMMPYRTRDLVMSKYLLGWILSAISAVGVLIVQTVLAQLNIFPSVYPSVTPGIVLAALGVALIIIAIIMPLMFRFGVEKGRVMMFVVIILTAVGGGAFASIVEDIAVSKPTLPSFVTAAASLGSLSVLLLAVVLTAISIPISIRLYRK